MRILKLILNLSMTMMNECWMLNTNPCLDFWHCVAIKCTEREKDLIHYNSRRDMTQNDTKRHVYKSHDITTTKYLRTRASTTTFQHASHSSLLLLSTKIRFRKSQHLLPLQPRSKPLHLNQRYWYLFSFSFSWAQAWTWALHSGQGLGQDRLQITDSQRNAGSQCSKKFFYVDFF